MVNEDEYVDWKTEQRETLIDDWMKTLPADTIPLDDDIADYADDHGDDFDAYCLNEFCKIED